MSWIDIAILFVWVVFIAVGARMGSLWTAGCLIGGFLGAFAADYYSAQFGATLGTFAGAQLFAGILLFVGGVLVGLAPGWILSRFSETFLTHIIDGFFGLATGVLGGFMTIALLLLLSVQAYSEMEQFTAWRKSQVAKPIYHALENHFEKHGYKTISFSEAVTHGTARRLEPLAEKAGEKAKTLSGSVVNRLKKE